MTTLSSGLGFKHRCDIQRDASLGTKDAGGQTAPPDWEPHLTGLPCRAFTNAAREPVDAGKSFVVEDRHVLVPVGTDVTEGDRVGDVIDQAAALLFEGPMNILGILRYDDHLELLVEEVRG